MKKSTYSTYSTTSTTPWLKWGGAAVIFGAFLGLIYVATANKETLTSEDDLEVVMPLTGAVKVRADNSGGMEVANRDKQVFDLLDGYEEVEMTNEDLCGTSDGAMVCNKELPKVTQLEKKTETLDDATKMGGDYSEKNGDIAGLIASYEQETTHMVEDGDEEVSAESVPAQEAVVEGVSHDMRNVEVVKADVKPLIQPIEHSHNSEKVEGATSKEVVEVSEPKVDVQVTASSMPVVAKADVVAKEKVFTENTWGVQLASYRDLASADKGSKIFLSKYPDLLKDLVYVTEKIDIPEKGTFYRVQFIGLKDKAAAKRRCDAIKAKGAGCWYVNK